MNLHFIVKENSVLQSFVYQCGLTLYGGDTRGFVFLSGKFCYVKMRQHLLYVENKGYYSSPNDFIKLNFGDNIDDKNG
jgi:hypothetical protein